MSVTSDVDIVDEVIIKQYVFLC